MILASDLFPKARDALVLVDVQHDFIAGSLAVPRGAEVVPVLNRYLALFAKRQLAVVATRDWHPANHCSFRPCGGPWSPHCVAGTPGAAFAPGLALPDNTIVISKAMTRASDAYSGFQGTDLDSRLRALGIARLFIGGLATDYCVLNTVLDARRLRYDVFLLADAIRAVEAKPGAGSAAEQAMRREGAVSIVFGDLAPVDGA